MSPQATVRSWDPHDRTGVLVRDDGQLLALPPGALEDGVRTLRPGQRLTLQLQDGEVVRATVSGLPFP